MQNQMGAATVDGFARMYLLPGVGHCGGGEGLPNIDLVSQVTGWVEQGSAPAGDDLRTDAAGAVTASRPVYPYPAVAQYKGSGDYKDAANWSQRLRLCTTCARLLGRGRCSIRRTRRSCRGWRRRERSSVNIGTWNVKTASG
jgi:hypothetical protein